MQQLTSRGNEQSVLRMLMIPTNNSGVMTASSSLTRYECGMASAEAEFGPTVDLDRDPGVKSQPHSVATSFC